MKKNWQVGSSTLGIDSREPLGQVVKGKPRPDIRLLLDAHDGVSYSDPETYIGGDYLLTDHDEGVVHFITRKSSDLAESLFSGHFADEIQKIVADPLYTDRSRVFFIIEGSWASMGTGSNYFKRINQTTMRASWAVNASFITLAHAQISVSTAGVEILTTADLHGTAAMLAALQDRCNRGWPTRVTKRMRRPQPKKSDDSRVQRLMALWPRLPENVAVTLLKDWGGIANIVMVASEGRGLEETKGVSTTRLDAFREVIK